MRVALPAPTFYSKQIGPLCQGAVLDVAVDIRKGITYGKHVAVELTKTIIVSSLFLVALLMVCRVEWAAVFQYKCDEFYHPEVDGGISILDDSLGIDWRIPTDKALLSDKDTKHALLKDFESPFDININLYK